MQPKRDVIELVKRSVIETIEFRRILAELNSKCHIRSDALRSLPDHRAICFT